MDSVETQKDLARFLENAENARKLNGLVEDVRYALMEYQVCTSIIRTLAVPNINLRLRYNKTSIMKVVSRS